MNGATPWPDCAFWDFSLALYAQPDIESLCLMLQKDFGLDVNLVLLAGWTACRGVQLEPDLAARLRSIGEDYQTTVMQPFRTARRGLKHWGEAAALGDLVAGQRRRLRVIELDLEHLEQLRLAALVETCQPTNGTSDTVTLRANLEALYPGILLPETALTSLVEKVAALRPGQPRHSRGPVFHSDSSG